MGVRAYAEWWNQNGVLCMKIESINAVLNGRGEVIAINNAKMRGESSLGFGIRADQLREMIQAVVVDLGGSHVNAKPAKAVQN